MTRPLRNMCELAVIGGGLAGLAAAHHAARLGRLVTLFEGSGIYGGQVATVDHVDGLGAPGHFTGQDVAIGLLDGARRLGVQVIEDPVARLDTDERLALATADGREFRPEAVIVASGASLRKLGVAGEADYAGRGVSRCATCDGGFFRGRDVAVIGGGDAAVTEALVLAKIAGTVHMVCRSPLKAKREYIDRLAAQANVVFHWDRTVTAIEGGASVTGLALRGARSGETESLACAGVFPFIGIEPVSGFMADDLRDEKGYIMTDSALVTRDPRVFAAGAVRKGFGGQAMQAMAEGISAAEAAARLLADRQGGGQ